jgi:FtsP/CotA-like multicopper oxidase with cupredoxin domain
MKFNRRQFLGFALASGIGAVGTNFWQAQRQKNSHLAQNLLQTTSVYRSSNGLLAVDLQATYAPINLGNQTAYLYTYNGQIPGPRLEAKAGDRVKIKFTNNLEQPTNIHYHGLHIPPTGKADNVFLSIKPQQTFTYEFELPRNHPPGIFWYHPHLHGYVAEQVAGGLAGLFIIRGNLDEIEEIKSAQTEFLVLQDFALDNQGKLLPSATLPIMMGREGDTITVNGKIKPTFRVSQGKLLRLRILNASSSRFYRLALDNHPFYLIAIDGRTITQPLERQEILLTPGQRAEILIQAKNNKSEYSLLSLPYQRIGMGMMGGGMMGGGMMGRRGRIGRRDYSSQPIELANLQFDSLSSPISLPSQLTTISQLPQPQVKRQFILNHGMSPGVGMTFLINGREYNHQRIDTQVKLGTVEDWELINTGVMDHPFHIHVNSFQVISHNGQPEPFTAWRDTVLVRRGETVVIRIPFEDFKGKTVYHCHIFDHEDLGMMGNLQII